MTSYYFALAQGAKITRFLLVDIVLLGLGFIFIEALRH